jgi:CxxC motif-containing protein (DUF1111 family)
MADLGQIMQDVFTGRMAGPELSPTQKAAVAHWVDAIPLLPHSPPVDEGAVTRGRALFASAGCASCHSGPRYTNGMTVDVGTGRAFQVPSLTGLSARAPFMHDGCAAKVGDRFTPSCGGAGHGVVTDLTAENRLDLQAFLESL